MGHIRGYESCALPDGYRTRTYSKIELQRQKEPSTRIELVTPACFSQSTAKSQHFLLRTQIFFSPSLLARGAGLLIKQEWENGRKGCLGGGSLGGDPAAGAACFCLFVCFLFFLFFFVLISFVCVWPQALISLCSGCCPAGAARRAR